MHLCTAAFLEHLSRLCTVCVDFFSLSFYCSFALKVKKHAALVENFLFINSDFICWLAALHNRLSFYDKMEAEKGTECGCALLTIPRLINIVFGPLCVSKCGLRLCSVKPEWHNWHRQNEEGAQSRYWWVHTYVHFYGHSGRHCTHNECTDRQAVSCQEHSTARPTKLPSDEMKIDSIDLSESNLDTL